MTRTVPVRVTVFYCLIVYALAWSLQFAAIHAVGGLEGNAAKPWLAGAMFVPALVALVFAWKVLPARGVLLWKVTWRMWPLFLVAVAIPIAIAFATVTICEITGWGKAGWF